MHGRYTKEELIALRESPLVEKPASLPPIEEWMGTIETKPRAALQRGKFDDSATFSEGFQKRPLLDGIGRRSTTDPEKIHLGPPRNSFTSSNVTRARNGHHERTKTNEDPDSKFGDRRSGAFGSLNAKFGVGVDNDSADRPRRRNDEEDPEGRPRGDYERTRWRARDGQSENERNIENGQRNGREQYSRAKFDQPWTRKENRNDPEEAASPPWRRAGRDKDHDRIDAEPEWADSADVQEPVNTHTHDDFRQWMESMKKKTATENKPESAQKEVTEPVIELSTPRVVSDPIANDRFFAKFEESKSTETQGNKRTTKSRFASMFGSKEDAKPVAEAYITSVVSPPPPAELEQPVAPPKPDQETKDVAFARLLEMLNKNQTVSPAPTSQVQSVQSPVNFTELASTRSPELGAQATSQPQSTRTPVSSHTPNLSLERIIESRSPAHQEHSAPVRSAPTDLLALLQRSTVQDRQPQPPIYHEERMPPAPPPGLSGYMNQAQERQGPPLINTRRDAPRSMFDNPAFQGFRTEPNHQQQPQAAAQPEHNGLGGLFAAINKQNYMTNAQQDSRVPPSQGFPPGLQRPLPGLDTARPPPGFQPPQAQQRQSSYPVSNYNIGPQQPLFRQEQTLSYSRPQRMQQPQRKPTGEPPMPPGFDRLPPGFGPSPNYASPVSSDTAMQYALRGANPSYGMSERERLERQQNAFAAMYGNGSGTRGNRGAPLPPGFE